MSHFHPKYLVLKTALISRLAQNIQKLYKKQKMSAYFMKDFLLPDCPRAKSMLIIIIYNYYNIIIIIIIVVKRPQMGFDEFYSQVSEVTSQVRKYIVLSSDKT
jgi:hypothetical protein